MTDTDKLAEHRTDWAEDRTVLANERTFAGWMRTGMACLGVALGLRAVFGAIDPTWVAKAAATVFVALAIFIFWTARQQACRTMDRLDDHEAEQHSRVLLTLIAVALALGAAMTGIILWLL